MDNQHAKQEPVHIKSVISDLLKKHSYAKKSSLFKIAEIWETAVGEGLAHNTSPWKMKGKTLEVHVPGSSWLQQLNYLKADMIQKINAYLGEECLDDIRFSIGRLPEKS